MSDFNWFPTSRIRSHLEFQRKTSETSESSAPPPRRVLSPTRSHPRLHPPPPQIPVAILYHRHEWPRLPPETKNHRPRLKAPPPPSPHRHPRSAAPGTSFPPHHALGRPSPLQPAHPEIWPSNRPHPSRAGARAVVSVAMTCCQRRPRLGGPKPEGTSAKVRPFFSFFAFFLRFMVLHSRPRDLISFPRDAFLSSLIQSPISGAVTKTSNFSPKFRTLLLLF
jgi:hypothetical protein